MLAEPRGHQDMYGCVLTEATHPDADFGVFYMHNSGYMDMCGHATIGVATALIDGGVVEVEEPVTRIKLDTPGGLVVVRAVVRDGRARTIAFRNVPAWVGIIGAPLEVPGYGEIIVDVGYGALHDSLFTSTWAQPVSRIRWQITEDLLLGRLAYERIEGSDGKGVGGPTEDGVIVAFENYLVEIPVIESWQ